MSERGGLPLRRRVVVDDALFPPGLVDDRPKILRSVPAIAIQTRVEIPTLAVHGLFEIFGKRFAGPPPARPFHVRQQLGTAILLEDELGQLLGDLILAPKLGDILIAGVLGVVIL